MKEAAYWAVSSAVWCTCGQGSRAPAQDVNVGPGVGAGSNSLPQRLPTASRAARAASIPMLTHSHGGTCPNQRVLKSAQSVTARHDRHSPGPAASDFRGQAAGGRPHPGRLQHPEGVHPAPGAAPAVRVGRGGDGRGGEGTAGEGRGGKGRTRVGAVGARRGGARGAVLVRRC